MKSVLFRRTGWFDHWGENRSSVSDEDFGEGLRQMLASNSSVNFFVFHGGTNFGYFNGANSNLHGGADYQPTVTSYDYDTQVDEAGRRTRKWHTTKQILREFDLLPGKSNISTCLCQ